MTHRYLPWVRRGLAASIDTPDDLGSPSHPTEAIAERARFDIGVEFNNDFTVDTALLLHGPGDVTGVDTRVIIRTDPERYVSDFEPNNMCSVEFDQPDFPWMFTPASADEDGRLRPWLVLVVVENRAGVTVGVQPGAISPVLEITSPAVSEVELPDLADSWAWAHAQVITENEDIVEIADEVASGHDRNLSRLLCPRRLKANRQYFACVVPAFEAGRLAGLGETIPAGLGLTPAWGDGGPVRLPVYFHWEFGTSNGGSDFEDLVDRIEPRELAESAGTVPMYVGEPGQGIAPLAADEAVLGLEGALRPITESGSLPTRDDVSDQLREDLRIRLNAPAEHLTEGAAPGAAPVGPPIYGAYHAATHRISVPGSPLWLDDLNQDPRLRAVAALGASIVRDNQEELMDEAWAQVGDVISANQLLNQAALSKAAAHSAYSRHLEPLPADRLFSITAPAHGRIKSGSQHTVRGRHDRSHLPNAATDPAFRRATSPQSRVLRRALRRAGAGAAAGSDKRGAEPGQDSTNRLMAGIDDGSLTLEDLSVVPDGIGRSQVFDHLDQSGGSVDMGPIGGVGSIAQSLVRTASIEMANLSPDGEPDPPLVPRRTMDDSGLITTDHMESASRALGNGKAFLLARVGEAIGSLRPDAGTTGLRFVQRPDGSLVPELISGAGGDDDPFPKPRDLGRTQADGDSQVEGDGQEGQADGVGDSFLPPPDQSNTSIRDFGLALREFASAFEPDLGEAKRPPLGLDGQRNPLLAANDPSVVAVRRTESRVDRGQWPQREPLDPIMVAPEFPTPLHAILAEKSRDHFLPGIGEIPPNSVVIAETNPRFVEAFMIGVNHEMNHELHWRQYPTDRRGTPFRHFWATNSGTPDIDPIHQWTPTRFIGGNMSGAAAGSVVLLMRAELLQHYPNTIIYAAPSNDDGTLDQTPANRKDPIMVGRLDPDVTFVMLPLTKAQLLADDGYYIVLQEQSTELRFGLDSPSNTQPPVGSIPSWNDLTWGHGDVAPGDHLAISGSVLGSQPPIGGVDFGQNSAHMAAIILQRPVMVAFHAEDMIGA